MSSSSSSSSSAAGSQRGLLVREADGVYRRATTDEVLAEARKYLARFMRGTVLFTSPQVVKDHLRMTIGVQEHESFVVLFLDTQHRLIEVREMFRGSLSQTSVYPREVVKAALALNAGAVVLAHNHPSGSAEPSRADEFLTQTLKAALMLVDVRVLDHFVVCADAVTSMAERGLM